MVSISTILGLIVELLVGFARVLSKWRES